ncbi:MAG: SGNH/GDSL hydrolase family protein [Ilumatobacteraceae bacterium]
METNRTTGSRRRRSLAAAVLLLATTLLGAVAPSAPTRADSGPVYQVRWSLNPSTDVEELSRVFDTDEDGHVDATPDGPEQLGAILNPQQFTMHVDVCFLPEGFSSVDWQLARPDETPQPVVTTTTCDTDLVLPDRPYPEAREYDITATVHWPAADDQTYSARARVQNVFMVGLGDSYGSGEGNPSNVDGREWDNERCHRSRASGQEVAARMLDQLPGITVTFLHVACSGAEAAAGILEPYAGLVAREPKLPPQIDQVVEFVDASRGVGATLPRRYPDLVVASIGGNDAGFADVVTACLAPNFTPVPVSIWPPIVVPIPADACYEEIDVIGQFNSGLANLPTLYQRIADAVNGDEFHSSRLCDPVRGCNFMITEYPDGSTDENGDPCGFYGPGFTESEFQWVIDEMVPRLDGLIQREAAKHGWTYVDGIRDNFVGHGICAEDDWMRDLLESFDVQGFPDYKGAFHPDWAGHLFGYAPEIYETAREVLGFPFQQVGFPAPMYGSSGAPQTCDTTIGDGDDESYVATPPTNLAGLGLPPGLVREFEYGRLPSGQAASTSCSSNARVSLPGNAGVVELRSGNVGCPDNPQPCAGSSASGALLRFPTYGEHGMPIVVRTQADAERQSGDTDDLRHRTSSGATDGTTAFIAVPATGSSTVTGEVVIDLDTVVQASGADASAFADLRIELNSVVPDPDCTDEACDGGLTTDIGRVTVQLSRQSCFEDDQFPHSCRSIYGYEKAFEDEVRATAWAGQQQLVSIDETHTSSAGGATMFAVRDGSRNPVPEVRIPYSVPAGAAVTVRVVAHSEAYTDELCTSNVNDFRCDATGRTAATIAFDPDLATGVVLPLPGFSLGSLPTDISGPVVTHSVDGPVGTNGWFTGPVSLTIAAADEAGGSGVGSLTYRVGTGDPITTNAATVTVPFADNGIRTVTYSAVDVAGNPSEEGSVAIKIDPLAPTISVDPPGSLPISPGQTIPTHLQCADTLSGVATCDGPASYDTSTAGSHTATFTAVDAAGNTASQTVTYEVVAPPPPPPAADTLTLGIPQLGYTLDGTVTSGGFTISRNAAGQPVGISGSARMLGTSGRQVTVSIAAVRLFGVWVGAMSVNDPGARVNVVASTLARNSVVAAGTDGVTGTFTTTRPARTITFTIRDLV